MNVLVIGTFNTSRQNRHELHVAQCLNQDFKYSVFKYDYREYMQKYGSLKATIEIENYIKKYSIDLIIIVSGRGLDIGVLNKISNKYKITIINWFHDYFKDNIHPNAWFKEMCSVCDYSFWTMGDERLRKHYLTKKGDIPFYLPTPPYYYYFHPIKNIEKKYDVIFLGSPHYQYRIELISYLLNSGLNLHIFGSGWPSLFAAHKNVYNEKCNEVINQSKVVLNINMEVPYELCFGDRYFYHMATGIAGVNQYGFGIEKLFTDGYDMLVWKTKEECLTQINKLLYDSSYRNKIAEQGYNTYIEKYTLPQTLTKLLERCGCV